ncbi:MAG: Kelch repeat-containing protein, partial [Chloroflexota bacterium]
MATAGLVAWPTQPSRASAPGWQVVIPTTPGPGPRGQYGMAADLSGHIYLYGGNGGLDTALDDFWEYDTVSNRWQALSNTVVPALIEPHLVIDGQGNVWEFGGIADPGAPHLTPDGHSFGLYEYQPALGAWSDRTPRDAQSGIDWPPGREDFGFAFDSRTDDLVVFAGEGEGEGMLNDLWLYNVRSANWTSVNQHYTDPTGVPIAPRELYNISADNHGHFYLFGGTFLAPPNGAGASGYANDLWRYDDATQTWTLLAGIANGYDPRMPLPRHYYGQTVDAAGDFDVLGGYLVDSANPPFFSKDVYARYALPFRFSTGPEPGSYGLSDFWRYDPISGWHDAADELGALSGSPMIPYMLVLDQTTNRLYT